MKKASSRIAELLNFKFTNKINLKNSNPKLDCFRCLDVDGKLISPEFDNIPKETAVDIFKCMVKLHHADVRFNMAQREGTISFYMTSKNEEASTVASAAALKDADNIFPQYREAGALMWRGFSIQDMAHQLSANEKDLGKGRQMPIHYGSKALNFHTVSSPLCTQVPQASGAGYHFRVKKRDQIAVTYFGEGAASEGDFHTALNFAATLRSQTLFLCRNNLFAISTSIEDQFVGDGIAARGLAYGIPTIRVDGNDVLAVYNAVTAARKLIVEEGTPALVESMSYRGGDHSTSDFSNLYRTEEEMKKWNDYLAKMGDPLTRYFNFLQTKGWITQTDYDQFVDEAKKEVRQSLKAAKALKKPAISTLFSDVYEKKSDLQIRQEKEMLEHIQKYPEVYNVEQYAEE